MPEEGDLGVIGGGPAGAMAAIESARHGLRVSIWDRMKFPHDKVCGAFLSPESLPLLRKAIPLAVSRSVPIFRADFFSTRGRRHSIGFHEPGAGLSRRALDEALWRAAAEAGAWCHEGISIAGIKAAERGRRWEVISTTGSRSTVRKMLLACGRWWKLDGLASPATHPNERSRGPWIGAKAQFRGVARTDAIEMYFFPGGYCGLAPIEDDNYNACCLLHRSIARRCGGGIADFRAWLEKAARHPVLAARLRNAIQVSETVTTAPVRPARRKSAIGGVLVAGDAAGFLDPFTGDGISMALHSGRLAARLLAQQTSPESSTQIARQYCRQLSRSVRSSYFWAALVRAFVRAPADLQDWFEAAIPPFLSSRLLAETRWREAQQG
jgi:menaquinone-9 beta-reductase